MNMQPEPMGRGSMLKQEILEAENYWALFQPYEPSQDTQLLLSTELCNGVPPIELYRPKALLLNDFDPEQVMQVISFMGRLAWDKDWNRDWERFIRHIIAMGHESVLEHVMLNFLVMGPRSLTHQLVRHRIGIAFTQMSQRFIKYNDAQNPVPIVLASHIAGEAEYFFADTAIFNVSQYRTAVNLMRMVPEDAREVLPNMTGSIVGTSVNLRELRHFLRLRMDKHAQKAIREVANYIYDAVCDAGLGVFVEDLDHLTEFDPRFMS